MTAHLNGAAAVGSELPTLLNVQDLSRGRFRRTGVFRAAGYAVIQAASAREALDAVTHRPLSIALIDVHLPDASGLTLCDTLKRLKPGLPVLLISAESPSPEARAAGLAAGAQRYLGEPMPSDILVRHVDEALHTATRRDADIWVLTDGQGAIRDASPLGARLLNVSRRGLDQRSLVMFFDQDRQAWKEALVLASQGESIVRTGPLRPRERRPVVVTVGITLADGAVQPALLWTIKPETPAGGSTQHPPDPKERRRA